MPLMFKKFAKAENRYAKVSNTELPKPRSVLLFVPVAISFYHIIVANLSNFTSAKRS